MEHIKKIIVSIEFDEAEIELGEYFKVKNANAIIDNVQSVVNQWKTYAELAEVRRASKNIILKTINRKF